MNLYNIDCELQYDLWAPSVFIFNVQLPTIYDESVVRENLTIGPNTTVDSFVDKTSGNRFIRVTWRRLVSL
jgi:hypothetical protein